MDESRPWTISFFTDSNGYSPVEEAISELPCDDQLIIDACIEKVRVRNITARQPLTDYIEEGLWELRPNHYRLLYHITSNRCIVFLHLFRKTTNKTPLKAKQIARKRRENYLSRP